MRQGARAGDDLASHHHARERGGTLGTRIAFRTDPAAAEHGRALAEGPHLVELVADIEDAAALGGEPAEAREELCRFLRRQHGGGLVHDEKARALHEAARDLDPLSLAHGEIVHRPLRLQGEAVVPCGATNALGEPPRLGSLEAEGDVLGHGQRLEEREMLEHHADAEAPGHGGARDLDGLALPEKRALVGADDAVDDLDERALAGTVLAEQRVDLSRQHVEIDMIVGEAFGETLGDAPKRQPRRPSRSIGVMLRHAGAKSLPCCARALAQRGAAAAFTWKSRKSLLVPAGQGTGVSHAGASPMTRRSSSVSSPGLTPSRTLTGQLHVMT